mmetsp:Transcript_22752/g.33018  ORF Transcript_22752/g.33018 Transcript_22752/m.33018 type:complete len:318 (-) Transcript_22752:126-1079(-)
MAFQTPRTRTSNPTGTAGSICGYLAAANAKLLCQAVESISPKNGLISEPDIEYLLAAVRDSAAVMKEVGEAMLFVHESRAAYLKLHGENFNERTSKAYMKSWVANYELSDFLAHNANKDLHEGNANVLYNFFRFNQYPQLAHATHEEAVRIAKDEAIFGGSVNVDGSITYANADSVFVVERFTPSRVLQTPSQWIQQERDQTGNENTKKDVKVFVIDLNGHFNAGFTCRTTELGNTAYMINSTDSNYLDRPSIAWLYDLVFMPSDSDGVTFPNLPSAPCDHSSTMAELISMGVEESLARDVLEKAHGDLRAAIDLLF